MSTTSVLFFNKGTSHTTVKKCSYLYACIWSGWCSQSQRGFCILDRKPMTDNAGKSGHRIYVKEQSRIAIIMFCQPYPSANDGAKHCLFLLKLSRNSNRACKFVKEFHKGSGSTVPVLKGWKVAYLYNISDPTTSPPPPPHYAIFHFGLLMCAVLGFLSMFP